MATQSTNIPAYAYVQGNDVWQNQTYDSKYWKQAEQEQEKTINDVTSRTVPGNNDNMTDWQKAAIPRLAATLNINTPTTQTPEATATPTSKYDGIKGKKDGGTPPEKKDPWFKSFLSSISEKGLWEDYSGPDRSFRTKGADGKIKYDWGAGAMNTLGNLSKYGAIGMSFVKDKEMANNTVNDAATSVRKTAQQVLLSTGNPIAMAIGATSMLSDKVGGTASATKGLGLGNDIGNFLASQVPFLGFLGKDMGKQFQSDELSGSSMYAWNSTADGLFGGKVLVGKDKANRLTQTNNMQRSMATNILRDAKLDFIGAQDPRYYMAAQNELNGGYDQVGIAKQGTVLQFTKRTLSKYKIKNHQSGGPITQQTQDGNFEIELERTPTYEEWLKNVPEDYRNENYDLKLFYNRATEEKELGNPELWNQLQNWLWAITRPTPEERKFYGDMLIPDKNGKLYNPYHLGSILEELDENREPTGDYIFLKLGTEEQNPELRGEIDSYHSGENGLVYTHDLVFDGDRYHYKLVNPEKFKEGGKVNVIPEGALHKNKHHLTDIDDKYKDVTTKGIPVVVESEGGEVIQQAEVERQEIIFRLEVTKKLEELSKEHTDKAAIEAGKLLVQEILNNTIDNTGEMI